MKLLLSFIAVSILFCLWAMLRMASIVDRQIEQNEIIDLKRHK